MKVRPLVTHIFSAALLSGMLSVGLVGCGGGSDSTPTTGGTPIPVGVAVNPSAVTLPLGRTQKFVATVAGVLNAPVTWTILEGQSGGTITEEGVYTAPTTTGRFTVVATNVNNQTQSGTATVTVTEGGPTGIQVQVSPAGTIVQKRGSQLFTATVTGTSDQRVIWRVQEGSLGGTISSNGLYTASDTPGTFNIVATSAADPNASGSASVNVQ